MKRSTRIIAAIAAAAALAAAGVVAAHPGSGMGGWGMGPGMYGMGPGMGGWGMGGPGIGGPGVGPGMRGMGPGMGPGFGMGAGPRGAVGGFDMAAATAGHLASLKTQLKITPAQEPAWKAYEGVVTQQSAAMQALHDKFQGQWRSAQPGATPPELAAHRDAMFAQRESSWKAQSAALKDLYAALTPEQRAIADRSGGAMGARRFGPR